MEYILVDKVAEKFKKREKNVFDRVSQKEANLLTTIFLPTSDDVQRFFLISLDVYSSFVCVFMHVDYCIMINIYDWEWWCFAVRFLLFLVFSNDFNFFLQNIWVLIFLCNAYKKTFLLSSHEENHNSYEKHFALKLFLLLMRLSRNSRRRNFI